MLPGTVDAVPLATAAPSEVLHRQLVVGDEVVWLAEEVELEHVEVVVGLITVTEDLADAGRVLSQGRGGCEEPAVAECALLYTLRPDAVRTPEAPILACVVQVLRPLPAYDVVLEFVAESDGRWVALLVLLQRRREERRVTTELGVFEGRRTFIRIHGGVQGVEEFRYARVALRLVILR